MGDAVAGGERVGGDDVVSEAELVGPELVAGGAFGDRGLVGGTAADEHANKVRDRRPRAARWARVPDFHESDMTVPSSQTADRSAGWVPAGGTQSFRSSSRII